MPTSDDLKATDNRETGWERDTTSSEKKFVGDGREIGFCEIDHTRDKKGSIDISLLNIT